jgi:hypothetical protein
LESQFGSLSFVFGGIVNPGQHPTLIVPQLREIFFVLRCKKPVTPRHVSVLDAKNRDLAEAEEIYFPRRELED